MGNRFLALVFTQFLALILLPASLHAEVRLPKIFGHHMVLQRDKPIVIWGWAAPGETVSIELGEAASQAKANEKGEWKTTLPALKASAIPMTLIVKGSNTIRF